MIDFKKAYKKVCPVSIHCSNIQLVTWRLFRMLILSPPFPIATVLSWVQWHTPAMPVFYWLKIEISIFRITLAVQCGPWQLGLYSETLSQKKKVNKQETRGKENKAEKQLDIVQWQSTCPLFSLSGMQFLENSNKPEIQLSIKLIGNMIFIKIHAYSMSK